MLLWELVIEVFEPTGKQTSDSKVTKWNNDVLNKRNFDLFGSIDYVPPSLPISYGRAKLYLLEDNDAVIKMIIKERSPQMRHGARTR